MSRCIKLLISFILLTICHPLLALDTIPDPTMPDSYRQLSPMADVSPLQDSLRPSDWVLNSTLISPEYTIAIINGRQLKVSDQIMGATILSIGHQHVVLVIEGKQLTLSLQQSFLSQMGEEN